MINIILIVAACALSFSLGSMWSISNCDRQIIDIKDELVEKINNKYYDGLKEGTYISTIQLYQDMNRIIKLVFDKYVH